MRALSDTIQKWFINDVRGFFLITIELMAIALQKKIHRKRRARFSGRDKLSFSAEWNLIGAKRTPNQFTCKKKRHYGLKEGGGTKKIGSVSSWRDEIKISRDRYNAILARIRRFSFLTPSYATKTLMAQGELMYYKEHKFVKISISIRKREKDNYNQSTCW